MGVDLTAGLSSDRHFVFAERPADQEMRESVNVWVWDECDDFAFPRIAIEAVADQWETHDLQKYRICDAPIPGRRRRR
jgi:hypothetical protein